MGLCPHFWRVGIANNAGNFTPLNQTWSGRFSQKPYMKYLAINTWIYLAPNLPVDHPHRASPPRPKPRRSLPPRHDPVPCSEKLGGFHGTISPPGFVLAPNLKRNSYMEPGMGLGENKSDLHKDRLYIGKGRFFQNQTPVASCCWLCEMSGKIWVEMIPPS